MKRKGIKASVGPRIPKWPKHLFFSNGLSVLLPLRKQRLPTDLQLNDKSLDKLEFSVAKNSKISAA